MDSRLGSVGLSAVGLGAVGLGAVLVLAGCARSDLRHTIGRPLPRQGQEISVCGELIHAGTRVVLWNDPFGYDAYRGRRHFEPDATGPRDKPERILRYDSLRRGLPSSLEERVRQRGWTRADLASVVRQVVLHYDAAGTSAYCFQILHDVRGLSSHFLIDLDGTIYQTLDLKERAWHAGVANDGSVGIEIAHPGAFSTLDGLRPHYTETDDGARLRVPFETRGHLSPDQSFAPSRPDPVFGVIQGQELYQYDYTDSQYIALSHLLATLTQVFPLITVDAPRSEDGSVSPRMIPDSDKFAGIVGHYHLTTAKVDPGPAFDWKRVLATVQALTPSTPPSVEDFPTATPPRGR